MSEQPLCYDAQMNPVYRGTQLRRVKDGKVVTVTGWIDSDAAFTLTFDLPEGRSGRVDCRKLDDGKWVVGGAA